MSAEITIDSQYLVTDSSTSDGTQIKYFYDNKWYKVDRYGFEGEMEALASKILQLSSYDRTKYVTYTPVKINGENGCVSDNFLGYNESFVSLYRLHANITGKDPQTVTSLMEYDEAIEYIIDFVQRYTGLLIKEYLADVLTLDAFILNEDRHFNNLGIIYDGEKYRPAPIFDNGKSLFIGNSKYKSEFSIRENKKKTFAKAFSGSFSLNEKYLKKDSSLIIDRKRVLKYLEGFDLETDNIYSRLYKLIKLPV